jgi:uncharacterized protein (TIGR03083 family)
MASSTTTDLASHCRDQLGDHRTLAAELDEAAWSSPSLCTGWTVKDVYAHLLYGRLHGMATMGLGLLRHRGSMDRWGDAVSRRLAEELPTDELVARFEAETSRWPERGIAGRESDTAKLADNVTHELDVRRALDRPRSTPFPADRLAAALAASTRTNMWGNKKRLAGLRFVATNVDWTHGPADGAEVRGPAEDLLLAVNGRPAGLAALEGPGVARLRERLGGR